MGRTAAKVGSSQCNNSAPVSLLNEGGTTRSWHECWFPLAQGGACPTWRSKRFPTRPWSLRRSWSGTEGTQRLASRSRRVASSSPDASECSEDAASVGARRPSSRTTSPLRTRAAMSRSCASPPSAAMFRVPGPASRRLPQNFGAAGESVRWPTTVDGPGARADTNL